MVQERVVEQESDILLVDELCHDTNFGVLLLDDVVLENGLGVQKVFSIRVLVLVILLFLLVVAHWLFLLSNYIWGQDYDLFGLHQVDTVIGFFLQRTSEHEVNLGVLIELLPLFWSWHFIVQDDDWSWIFCITISQRHNEMTNVLDHTANNDVVNCQHLVL